MAIPAVAAKCSDRFDPRGSMTESNPQKAGFASDDLRSAPVAAAGHDLRRQPQLDRPPHGNHGTINTITPARENDL